MSTAIHCENITKSYKYYPNPTKKAINFLSFGRAFAPQKFKALDNVSFSMEKGTTMGIIGANGAGKSTLLKVVSKLILPEVGSIQVHGEVSALIELGTGFHPELSGRENFIHSIQLSSKPIKIADGLEYARDFAELDDYFDMPIKTYSTGMLVRLAFATSTVLEPDILIVDEAMAVGDEYFQHKCIDRIQQLKSQGTSILFVSHSMPMVEMLCDKAIYLERGRVLDIDDVTPVVRRYLSGVAKHRGLTAAQDPIDQPVDVPVGPSDNSANISESDDLVQQTKSQAQHVPKEIGGSYGNGKIRIHNIQTFGGSMRRQSIFNLGDDIVIAFDVISEEPYENAVFGVSIFDIQGTYMLGTNNHELSPHKVSLESGKSRVSLRLKAPAFNSNTYFATVSAFCEPQYPFWPDPADYHHKSLEFKVESGSVAHGVVIAETEWSHL